MRRGMGLVLAVALAACQAPEAAAPRSLLAASPSPSAVPSAVSGALPVTVFVPFPLPAAPDLIPFASNRAIDAAGGFDLYVFDRAAETVWLPPGANTRGDELNPTLVDANHMTLSIAQEYGATDILGWP